MSSRVALAACLLAGMARAEGASTALEFSRLPLSVRQQAGGGYGSYDVFRAFDNPALLANQPRVWEAAAVNHLYFGGDENLWGIAASHAGTGGETGAWAFAVMASGLGSGEMKDRDIYGVSNGVTVTSAGSRFGAAAAYQWPYVQLGIGVGRATESLEGIPGKTVEGPSTMLIDLGITGMYDTLMGGAAYHIRSGDAAGAFSAGASVRLTSPLPGSVGAELNVPAGGGNAWVSGGATWNVHPVFDVRAGAYMPAGGGTAARAGFTARFRGATLDYALSLPVGTGPGPAHMVQVGYAFGPERQIGPRKRIVFALSMVERTMAIAAFEPQGVSAVDASVVADLLRSALVQSEAFNIVEKANMDKILAEQAFQQTGCTSAECAVKLGKILNVKYLIVGSFAKTLDLYFLTIRVVDISTAKAVYADEAEGASFSDLRAGIRKLAGRLAGAVE